MKKKHSFTSPKTNKRAYNILNALPKRDLIVLAALSGLDLDFYSKNKTLLVNGVFISMGGDAATMFDICQNKGKRAKYK